MSLKFGIYLVEQRIISPEQFCGLVKIQQDATMSLATIAIRRNLMTIRQVADVLDLAEVQPDKSFLQIALEQDLIERGDAEQMLQLQQQSTPRIRRLVVECGLLTKRQSAVLFDHFQRQGNVAQTPSRTASEQVSAPQSTSPRPPKFQQHPVVTRQTQVDHTSGSAH